MTTAFDLLLTRCGLSHRDAAGLLGVRFDTVRSWASGHDPMPPGAIDRLRTLYAAVERAAGEMLATAAEHPEAEMLELGLASDDAEAQSLGWPCLGPQAAMLGLVVARSDRPCRISPRGSTPATAAAADTP